jgi:hypothetical protein
METNTNEYKLPESHVLGIPCEKYELSNKNYASDLIKDLECSICQNIFNKPVELKCGHVFCKGCIGQWFKVTTKTKIMRNCPMCKKESADTPKISIYLQRLINNLEVKCLFCNWTGSAEQYRTKHANQIARSPCKLMQSKCTYCDKQYFGKQHKLTECEFRQVSCEKCSIILKHSELNKHIINDCPEEIIKCNSCKNCSNIKEQNEADQKETEKETCNFSCCRKDMSNHEEKCEYVTVDCKFKDTLGCSTSIARKDMKTHENDLELHINIAVNTIDVYKKRDIGLKTHVFNINDRISYKHDNKWTTATIYEIYADDKKLGIFLEEFDISIDVLMDSENIISLF